MGGSRRQLGVLRTLSIGSVLLLPLPREVAGEDASVATSMMCTVVTKDPAGVFTQIDCGGTLFVEKQVCDEAENQKIFTSSWWTSVLCCLLCIVCAALAAGLTLGLTSIEEFDLKVLLNQDPDGEELCPHAKTPEKEEERLKTKQKLVHDQQCAKQILPLISGTFFGSQHNSWRHRLDPTNEHYLLVTLLLANATANEALPLFLDKLVSPAMACLLSVSVVLIFGEIIPSAVFTGPSQLTLAARMSCIVRSVKFLLMPIAWPLSMMLDRCLGHNDEETYNRSQMKGLIRALRAVNDDTIIDIDEANMMHGVLELHYKTAEHIAHDINEAKMLAHDTFLDMKKFEEIDTWGHSRVFVFRRDSSTVDEEWGTDIMGVLLLKKLLTLDPNAGTPMQQMASVLKPPVLISPEENLLSILNKFQEGHCHMAIVSSDPDAVQKALEQKQPIPEAARPFMFCTLEDVIEELLKEEIYDEEDNEKGLRQDSANPAKIKSTPLEKKKTFLRKQTAFFQNLQAARPSDGGQRGRPSKLKRSQTLTPRLQKSGCNPSASEANLIEPLLSHTTDIGQPGAFKRNFSQ